MELVDRYLKAVRFWLPKTRQEDILAELSEGIRAQIDEKEAELGRKLTDAAKDWSGVSTQAWWIVGISVTWSLYLGVIMCGIVSA